MSPCDVGARKRPTVVASLGRAVAAICLLASPLLALPATTDISSIPLPTYAVGSGTDVKPNILMVLDDSGSMDWNYLPDWANDVPPNYSSLPEYLFRNATFNGVAYNPAVTYLPPIRFNANGTKDTTTFPSMTGASTATGADSTTKPNWKALKNDGFGVQSTSTSNITNSAYFYTTVPGVYCDSPAMTNCTTSATPTGNFAYPAPLRWCSNAALTTCRALQDGTYNYPRMPAPRISVISLTSIGTANVTGITVDGLQIMSGATGNNTTRSALATAIANNISNCTNSISGNCTTVGYLAYASGSTVTVLAPGSTASAPVLAVTGTLGSTVPAFAGAVVPLSPFASGTTSSAAVPGENLRTNITSTVASYAYPGTAAKAATRTDCAGTTCTFQEEMTNYANWFSYYSTRMQMMKSSTSRAFSVLDTDVDIAASTTRYRVGYLSINNNTGSDFVNITDFLPSQKVTWYSKLLAAVPNNSTPLRRALSTAGRLYGGVLNGQTLNGTTVVDPMQYSCGKNFTILSTDGFWNGTAGVKLDGSTAVGNADGALSRPYSDGASTQLQTRTSQLQQRTNVLSGEQGTLQQQISFTDQRTSQLQKLESQLQSQTSQLQKLESQLQQQTSQLQKLESQLQQSTSTLQSMTSQLQQQNSTLETRTSQLQIQTTREYRTSSNSGSTFGAYQAWTDPTANCTNINSGVNQRQCRNNSSGFSNAASCTDTGWINCQYTGFTGWTTSVGSCSAQAQSAGPNYTVGLARECRYTAGAFNNALACTVVAPSAGPNYTVTTAVACQYLDGAVTPAASCTTIAKSTGPVYATALARTCSYTAPTTFASVGSCTVVAQSTGPVYTVQTASNCQYLDSPSFVATPSCTVVAKSTGPTNYTVGIARQCQYTPFTAYANAASCTVAAQSTGPNYTVGVASNCQYVDGTFVATPSCAVVAKSTGPAYSVGLARQCQYTPYTAYANAASCTAAAPSTAPNYTVGTPTNCQYVDQPLTNTASCTVVAKSTAPNYTVGLARQCSYTAWTAYAASTGVCPALAQSTGPSYTVGVATDCRTTVTSPFTNASSCSVTTPNASGLSTQCQYNFAVAAATQVCTPLVVANDYSNATVYRNCATTSGSFSNATSCTATTTPNAAGETTTCAYTAFTTWSSATSCVAAPQSTSPVFTVGVARDCQNIVTSGGTSDTLADVAAYYYNTDLRSSTATGVDATGTCVGPIISPATTASDLCADNVPTYGRDTNTKQHMTTHTLGLGAQGMMVYSPYQNNTTGQRVFVPDYWTQPSGDFYAVANASTANTSSGICPWLTTGSACTWPVPSSDSIANIDDLWHAAVNGRGTYFSATDPSSLASALQTVLSQIVNTPRPGTAAAAASSNPNITSSDNYVFSSSYESVDWFGELIMQRFNADGTLTAQQWSAMQLLDCSTSPWRNNFAYSAGSTYSQGGACYVVNADYTSGAAFASAGLDGANVTLLTGTPYTRTIYTAGISGTAAVLVPFTWAGLSTAQQAYFSTPYINYVSSTQGLTQFCASGGACMGAAAQVSAAGSSLVSFLRGDRTNEGTYYRTRKRVLGDIVSSEARYVKQPLQSYTDAGYADFKTLKASRTPTVYVGSNDGMLHAFEALTGKESWAFVPSAVLPEMYRLADTNYTTKHRYFVDGTPEVGDICPTAPSSACADTTWKTMLVGGMNAGGKSFYALDITNPASPVLMWEFTDPALGLSYSNPRITKLADGTWVVLVASGYNNADGIGRLFVIKASDGTLIRTISTGVGTAATPSGLAKLAARASLMPGNNTVDAVYGGDLLGNLWRFDVNNTVGATGYDAQLLVTLKDAAGNVQPITAKPTVGVVGTSPLIMVGTGRYLGLNDLSDTSTFSMYALKDKLDAVTLPSPRSVGSNFVQQTLFDGTCPSDAPPTICNPGQVVRTASNNAVDWGVRNGWYLDFLTGGERSATDATLALGTLAFTTVKPQSSVTGTVSACTTSDVAVSAKSYLYYLNYLTGGPVAGTGLVVGEELCTCVATRPSVVKTERGDVEGIIRTSGGGATTGTDMGITNRQSLPVSAGTATTRRVSWRELNGE